MNLCLLLRLFVGLGWAFSVEGYKKLAQAYEQWRLERLRSLFVAAKP